MKNIFKFMGIALMACSLTLVSCNKDDDNSSTSDNGSISITFGGAQSTPIVDAHYLDITSEFDIPDGGSIVLYSCIAAAGTETDEDGEELYKLPLFYISTVKTTGLSELQIEDGFYVSDQIRADECAVVDANEDEWSVVSINSISFGEFDATSNALSYNLSLKMRNDNEYSSAAIAYIQSHYAEEWATILNSENPQSALTSFLQNLYSTDPTGYQAIFDTAAAAATQKDLVANATKLVHTLSNN